MTVHDLPGYLVQSWPAIREQLLSGTYRPQPAKRVEIPKPDGGVRKLGIPTVLDRFIQQAVMLLPPNDVERCQDMALRRNNDSRSRIQRCSGSIGPGHQGRKVGLLDQPGLAGSTDSGWAICSKPGYLKGEEASC